jgi:hypothetical protein
MNDKYTNEPEKAGDSWANETLPMGIRRELLDREIRKVADRKGRAQSLRMEAAEPPAEHPSAGERHG